MIERLQHPLLLERLYCKEIVVLVLGGTLLMGVQSKKQECQKLEFGKAPVFLSWRDVSEMCSCRLYEE